MLPKQLDRTSCISLKAAETFALSSLGCRFTDHSKTYPGALLQIYTPDHSKRTRPVHQNFPIFGSHAIQHLFSNNTVCWSFIVFGYIFSVLTYKSLYSVNVNLGTI